MSPIEEILSEIPINQLAGQLGVDAATAEQASRQVLPALLGGIQANTDDPGGAASFAQAVQQHDGGLVEGGVDLGQVDTRDGDKIVNHVFGPNRDQVEGRLGALGGVGGQDLIAKLLPILAPIVMAWLSKKLSGAAAGQGGDLGSVFGAGAGGTGAGGVVSGTCSVRSWAACWVGAAPRAGPGGPTTRSATCWAGCSAGAGADQLVPRQPTVADGRRPACRIR